MRLLLGLALLLTTSCVRLQWTRDRRFEPLSERWTAALRIDESDLGACLAALGAPHLVSGTPDEGMWLVWGWSDDAGWSVSVSYQVVRFVSPSLTWRSGGADLEGLVLRLDRDLVLREMRRGRLSAILAGGKDVNRRERARAD